MVNTEIRLIIFYWILLPLELLTTFSIPSLTLFLEKRSAVGALILLLIIILPCIVRILQQNIQKLVTELHLTASRNKKGGDARSQCEELHPWQRSWGRRLGIRKGGIEPQETPCSRAFTPKTRVCLLYCFMRSPIPLTLWGTVPHHLSKNSWAWQECFHLQTALKVL